jgi:hypothetical protein
MLIKTYNEYHLGDQLHHLNYLRKVCQLNPEVEAIHSCKKEYHEQLKPLLEGLPITLTDLDHRGDAINAWIGTDGYFYNSPLNKDWVAFHLDWFSHLSNKLGVMNPMQTVDTFLFDYPELGRKDYPPYDILIVNSVPMSGQLPDYNPWFFERLVKQYKDQGLSVITTYPTGLCQSTLELNMSVTDIGCLAKGVQRIQGVDTGPMWTTYNVHARIPTRIVYSAIHAINLLDTITYSSLSE